MMALRLAGYERASPYIDLLRMVELRNVENQADTLYAYSRL